MLSDEWSAPLPARFTYRAADPYAVRLDFYLTMASPISWIFARELLVAGGLRSSGLGDVRAWPGCDGRFYLCLSSGDGEALLEVPTDPLSEWLERTYRLVPPGKEYEHQALDSLLWRLVDESPDAAPEGQKPAGRSVEGPADPVRPRTGSADGPAGGGPDGSR
ncbi:MULTISPECIES: SsgA family sporulation/cell division regulator [Streptomyces]|uniref:SsgA family sporulation/cell division regulator n=1 Tax=Streptomyces TaxID=1883 RepID=UPI000B26CE6E|nr:SsgA family sporulation/cell division regulator [Streptomyces sp. SCSIO ZS0520]